MSPFDLQTQAGELGRRLSHASSFVVASRDLLAIIRGLHRDDYRRHSRKIITLVEIARNTLIRAGVRLHTSARCAPGLVKHKDNYFQLLRLLQEHEHSINNPALKDRASRLLLPLSFPFASRNDHETIPSHICDSSLAERNVPFSETFQGRPSQVLMPPPSTIPSRRSSRSPIDMRTPPLFPGLRVKHVASSSNFKQPLWRLERLTRTRAFQPVPALNDEDVDISLPSISISFRSPSYPGHQLCYP